MARKTENRFFDDGDFTPDHDRISTWLLSNWRAVVRMTMPEVFSAPWSIDGDDLNLEPVLEGYPPVFPDGLARVVLHGDHRDKPVELRSFQEDTTFANQVRRSATIGCAGCGRTVVQWLKDGQDEESFRAEWEAAPKVWNSSCSGPSFPVVFEIKTKDDSFGRVLRQMKLYGTRVVGSRLGTRSQCNTCQGYHQQEAPVLILITPDDRFDGEFRSQGVRVFHPPESLIGDRDSSTEAGRQTSLGSVELGS